MTQNFRKTLRKVVRLALPAISENVLMALVNIVDVAMVGSLGAVATASAALNAQPMMLAFSLTMLSAGSVGVMVARSWGADDKVGAANYARVALLISSFIGAVLTLLAWLGADAYMTWMRAAPDVKPNAVAYMHIVGSAMIPMVLSRTLASVLQGSGDTLTPMKISFATNMLNMAGNFLLIYSPRTVMLFGLAVPIWGAGMGVRGAALSTAFSFTASALCQLTAVSRRRDGLRIGLLSLFKFDVARIKSLLRIGFPISAERFVTSSGQMLYMSIIATLGTVDISAHYIASTVEGICYNPAFGIAVASTALVGQALGAGDEERAIFEGNICVSFSVAAMLLVSTVMFIFAPQLMVIFSRDLELVKKGATVLRIVAFAEILLGVNMVCSGALRAAGETVFPFWMGILCMYIIRLFTARLFVLKLNLGLPGAWYAMDLDMVIRGILVWLYWRSGRWKKKSRRLTNAVARS